MNAILLDSQIFLWAIADKPDLSRAATKLILYTPNVYVSVLSLFELKAKEAAGKLTLPRDLENQALIHNIKILDFTSKQLKSYKIFSDKNSDPFDNILLTVSESQHLSFVTADQKIIDIQKSHDWIINGA